MEAAISAAAAVARTIGLQLREPTVLWAAPTTVVHLVREPLVARVVPDGGTAFREPLERELVITTFLDRAGGEVVAPARSIHPGPYQQDGMLVTLWEYVDHDPSRTLDAVRGGRALREIHRLLRDVDTTTLHHFAPVEENRALVARLDLEPPQRRLFDEVLDAVRVTVDGLDAELQAVHGDAHLGNVLRTRSGPSGATSTKSALPRVSSTSRATRSGPSPSAVSKRTTTCCSATATTIGTWCRSSSRCTWPHSPHGHSTSRGAGRSSPPSPHSASGARQTAWGARPDHPVGRVLVVLGWVAERRRTS